MEKIVRFGVSIEPDLLDQFDTIIKNKGYTNRSEALRDLIRKTIVREQSTNPEAEGLGTLTMVYDHHAGPLTERLLEIQHDHHQEILTTTHIHIDHHHCLEVLVLKGKTGSIQTLADTIIALKGIKHGELVLTSSTL
jgi:CopG family nickel-responsive transcriptional regulator